MNFLRFSNPLPALEMREWDRDDALEGRDTSICRAINATYARFFFLERGDLSQTLVTGEC